MNNNTNKPSVGIRAWGTTPKKENRFQNDDLPRLPWLKLRPGLNDLRVVAGIGTYYQVRWKGPKSKSQYGDRIRTSWPTYLEECPVKNELLLEPKEHYITVVIDRFDGSLKLFDFGQSVLEQVETTIEAKNSHRKDGIKVSPRDFDISVNFNPKSNTPSGYYGVVGQDYDPMSQEDLDLVKDVGGEDVLDKVIQRQLICPKPETVRKRLTDLGWDGKAAPKKPAKGEKVAEKQYTEPTEDDYSFERPTEEVAE